jgi:hypothetical protein
VSTNHPYETIRIVVVVQRVDPRTAVDSDRDETRIVTTVTSERVPG